MMSFVGMEAISSLELAYILRSLLATLACSKPRKYHLVKIEQIAVQVVWSFARCILQAFFVIKFEGICTLLESCEYILYALYST